MVEGGYCSDTRREDKLKEKEDQHHNLMLRTALEDHENKV